MSTSQVWCPHCQGQVDTRIMFNPDERSRLHMCTVSVCALQLPQQHEGPMHFDGIARMWQP